MEKPRLINVDNAIKELEELAEYSFVMTDKQVKFFLANQPTIDPLKHGYVLLGVHQQVQWERDTAIRQLESYGVEFGEKADVQRVKHGKWVICSNGYYPYCSECHFTPKEGMSKYCPDCGSRMDGE